MKNKLLPLFFVLASYSAYSQVGIGTTMPNPSSQLEVVANDKGVLIPRVQLKSLTDAATITNGNVNSLLVFNTGTAADIKPGYYYWYDNRWNRIVIAGEIESNKGTVIYNAVTKEFVFVDDSGNNQPLDLKNFETITTLKKDAANDGKYVYTNEGKAETTIDVVADVINNAHTIIKNEKFVTELTQFVDSKETVTTLEKNAANDGKYLYTNEDKAETTIDVVADVINNAGAIISNEKFVTELTNVVGSKETLTSLIYDAAGKTLSYQAEKGAPNVINLVDLVGDAETITEIVNKGKGVYTYKNETTAEPVTINVVGDVADNFQTIINNPEVTNVLNTFITKSEGTVSFNSTTNEFTYTDASGATQTVNINEIVKGNETLTSLTYDAAGKTLSYQAEKGAPNVINLVDLVGDAETITEIVNKGKGVYTYKNETTAEPVTINVVGDVADNFQTIINNPEVTNVLNTFITKSEGTVSFNSTTNEFTYTDASGATQTVNINEIVKGNETLTSLTYDAAGKTLSYQAEKGAPNVINLVDLVGDAETITEIVNKGKGVYTYKNETTAEPVTINVVGDVADNFQTIINNPEVTNVLNTFITKSEGTVSFNSTTNEFTYTDASGATQTVNINEIVKGNETLTSLTYDAAGKTLSYQAEKGAPNVINLVDLVGDAETITEIVSKGKGVYTYKNETTAEPVTINVVGDVADNFQTIINNPEVTNVLNTFITKSEGTVSFNSTTNEFTYTDASGATQTVNINEIVKGNETLTSLTYDAAGKTLSYQAEKGAPNVINLVDLVGDAETITEIVNKGKGVYTYKNETTAEPVTINVVGDVADNFQTIINNPEVTNVLNTFITKSEGTVSFNSTTNEFTYTDASGATQTVNINEIVKGNETLTSLTYDAAGKTLSYQAEKGAPNVINLVDLVGDAETITEIVNKGKGVYTYKNETTAEPVTINVVGDVADNFQTIINNPEVTNVLNTFITKSEGTVSFNSTTNEFTYTDASGATQTVNINEIVKGNETLTSLTYDAAGKTLSYQAEKGAPNVINLVDLVGDAETITEIVNKGKGVYTYKNETTAEPVTINVVGDVADNFQTIINNPEVTNVLNTFITKSEGTVSFNSTTNEFTYTDASGATQTVNINEIVKGNETLTSLTYDAAGKTLSYQAEKGAPNVIKLVDLVGAAQTLTSLAVNGTTGTLDYKDENNFVTSVNLSAAVKEPWFSSTTKAGATTNTENIYTQGWVGIGFDTPSGKAGEKLRINGSITTVNSTYADYVFEDYFQGYSDIKADYKFKGLAEIEQYIKTHKHLPGITPINELERTSEGYSFNMSELSIQLLEKTEEIYLHIIEQNNAIIAKDKEIAKMNERLERLEKLIEENTTSSNQAPVSSN
ncbi:hypothetical protein [Flavobacterium sp. 2]|uniref:beta strand repeat-containing protein n=1 Tax=Flavobacterium sp. 2 TaxID=308053 RepID=UPI000C17D3DA|nr:hypothetical protein [Flavobacterium sp. 2]PIF71098.1 hypothetical protein CLU99_1859 [Flavobacterium sp. 2]